MTKTIKNLLFSITKLNTQKYFFKIILTHFHKTQAIQSNRYNILFTLKQTYPNPSPIKMQSSHLPEIPIASTFGRIFSFLSFSEIAKLRPVSKIVKKHAEVAMGAFETIHVRCCWSKCKLLNLIALYCPNVLKVVLTCRSDDDTCPCLQNLLLSCPKIQSIGMIPAQAIRSFPAKLDRIEKLSLSVSDEAEIEAVAAKCANLKTLELEWGPFDDTVLNLTSLTHRCEYLTSLSMWGTKVDPAQLAHAERLKELFFYATDCDDAYLEKLALGLSDKQIRRIKVSGQKCSIRGVLSLALYLSDLVELNISYTGVALDDLVELLAARNSKGEFRVFRCIEHISVKWDVVKEAKKRIGVLRKGVSVDCNSWCQQN